MKRNFFALMVCISALMLCAQGNYQFNGLDMNMGNLSRLSNAKSRSISPENYTGEKGGGAKAKIADKDKRNVANAA